MKRRNSVVAGHAQSVQRSDDYSISERRALRVFAAENLGMATKDIVAWFKDKFHRRITPSSVNASLGPEWAHLDLGGGSIHLNRIHLSRRGCGKTFKKARVNKLTERHERSVHGDIPGICPDGCGQRLKNKLHASRHALVVHSGIRMLAAYESQTFCPVVHCINNTKMEPIGNNYKTQHMNFHRTKGHLISEEADTDGQASNRGDYRNPRNPSSGHSDAAAHSSILCVPQPSEEYMKSRNDRIRGMSSLSVTHGPKCR